MQEQLSEYFIYIKGTLKYKWFAICLAWIICLIGWTFIMLLPNQYTSRAKVHIDSTTLLQPLLKDIAIRQDGNRLVGVMKKLMFTVPNLDKIIELSNLDYLVTSNRERYWLYEDMRKDIGIKGGKRDGLFEVSYEAHDAEMAKNVVTAVLTVFSEQTQLSTMEDVSSSQRFIEKQIREYEVRLRNSEQAKEAFKRSNVGLLPEQGQGQISKLHGSYDQLESAKLALNEAISKRNILISQMKKVVDAGDSWGNNESVLTLSPEDQQIRDLQLKKQDLLLKYTENHPSVTAIKLTLAEILKRKEQKDLVRVETGLPNIEALANPYVQQLKISLNIAEAEVASNQVRVDFIKQRIDKYKEQLNLRLTVETEMQNLNRDYQAINQNYQKLLQRREQARMSGKVDTETVAIKFKIADPPTKPLIPSGPKRFLLLTGVLFIGLGTGFGIAYLFYYLKPTFITTKQLRTATGLPVLGFVSLQAIDDLKKNRQTVIFLSVLFGLAFIYLSLMGLEFLQLRGSSLSGVLNKLLFKLGIF